MSHMGAAKKTMESRIRVSTRLDRPRDRTYRSPSIASRRNFPNADILEILSSFVRSIFRKP